ncbi:MAG: hypothetical protein HYX62_04810 [Gammaproteobacteria bacterium]|nr:hypothetical protein [Gammaproteobacteria bacterium]
MPDLAILHQMIKDGAKVPLLEKHGKKSVVLSEPQHPDSSVTIAGMPDNTIVIKADAFKSPDTVFAGLQGECKRADFVIVADTGKKKSIVCIEMKAKKASEKEIIQQLSGAECFIVYCREIGKSFWKQQDFLADYSFRFISIGHTSIPKRRTRIDRSADVHDRPDRMLKISSPHRLQFNQLAGAS